MQQYFLTVSCCSRRGIVGAIGTFLADMGCNITDSSQFDDLLNGKFFMRVSFVPEEGASLDELSKKFAPVSDAFDMTYSFHDEDEKMKVVIMVSKFGHCLNDLLYRWQIGSLPIQIVAVISNHENYRTLCENRGVAFHHIPVTAATKADAERQQIDIIKNCGAELVVLARYMQVLSDDMCRKLSGRIINIHHSFLPSFKGAAPYKQAFDKGVKLIGATAHYVTADLDEGPIIEQDTVRVTHQQSPDDYVSLGRDVECRVLSRAIHAHAGRRSFINGSKTVVFPASPGSYASDKMG